MKMVETPLEWGPDSGGRQKGTTIVKQVVYGNIAKLLPERLENKHTHEWTAYLKPFKNESMTYIKKVSFKLHESYENNERVMTTPPFEVRETGWGEFELTIKIFFVDPNERPVTIYHQLKLFQNDPALKYKTTLVNEHYDEIVFQDPSLMMTQILNAPPKPFMPGSYRHEVDFDVKGTDTLTSLAVAKKKVRAEITTLKDRLRKAIEAKAKLQEQLEKESAAT